MRIRYSRALAGAVAFAALSPASCIGWDPTGSCVYSTTDAEGSASQACVEDVTAAQCANDLKGQFDEGGNCILFDILSGGPR
jgi:hypothetical protein